MEVKNLHQLQPGTMLHQRYRIECLLGAGGFGITYRAMDETLKIPVAVKEYFPSQWVTRNSQVVQDVILTAESRRSQYDSLKEKFLEEARVLAMFENLRSVVRVRDFFYDNQTAYIVMEYLDGITLGAYIAKNGAMEPEWLCSMVIPMLRELDAVHQKGLIHRDISPDNIMLMNGEYLKLMDFGAARSFSEDTIKSMSVILKHGYAPYEQYTRHGRQGPWTDVYALSATIYSCITRVVPDSATDRVEEDELRKPSELGVAISPAVEAAILKGMSLRREERYQSAMEMADALSRALKGEMPVIENRRILRNGETHLEEARRKAEEQQRLEAERYEAEKRRLLEEEQRRVEGRRVAEELRRKAEEQQKIAAANQLAEERRRLEAAQLSYERYRLCSVISEVAKKRATVILEDDGVDSNPASPLHVNSTGISEKESEHVPVVTPQENVKPKAATEIITEPEENQVPKSAPKPTPLVPKKTAYTIRYYYDGVEAEKERRSQYGYIGDVINAAVDSERRGYLFERADNYPLTISKDTSKNTACLYYVNRKKKEKEKKKGLSPLLVIVLIIALFAIVIAMFELYDNKKIEEQLKNNRVSQNVVSAPSTATYEVMGFAPMKVRIALDDTGRITSVMIEEHNEILGADLTADTERFEKLIGQDIQTVQFDAKSGATLTSNGIQQALDEAREYYLLKNNRVSQNVVSAPSTATYGPLEIKLEGEAYEMPCELSQFLKNGWKLYDEAGNIVDTTQYVSTGEVSGRYELSKNGKKATVQLNNEYLIKTAIESCTVSNIHLEAFKGNQAQLSCKGIDYNITTPDTLPDWAKELLNENRVYYHTWNEVGNYFYSIEAYMHNGNVVNTLVLSAGHTQPIQAEDTEHK